jgi:hypothetical protein
MKPEKIYFNPNEVNAIAMGLARIMEDIKANELQPWTPEMRKITKEILTAARSAAHKLEKFTGVKCELPPYNEGDENEFLTKQS